MFIVSASELSPIADVGWSSWLLIAVIVVAGIGAVYGLKTRKGSGINEHPGPNSDDPVITGQSDPATASGNGDGGPGEEDDKDSMLGQRGTK